jgi:hypothetical protein
MTGETDDVLRVGVRDARDRREFVVERPDGEPAVSHAQTSVICEQRPGRGIPLL